ncbi:hypothetical protein TNIN_392711 [Trichonephila inaurata madagascariensis]|uniref:Uncharacterized protein n=1 Tax=Trichonephila inaurata madagascariensis TaxID=2747483 RepID=A0A8X6XBY9_9ARAC|nr:hypothetical protein TNIN_392711 [Trichonephila inaurata madagascariensis]
MEKEQQGVILILTAEGIKAGAIQRSRTYMRKTVFPQYHTCRTSQVQEETAWPSILQPPDMLPCYFHVFRPLNLSQGSVLTRMTKSRTL